MNFLAHLYLSGDHPQIAVGNFIGDFVKGRNVAERYPSGISKGVEMHRAIDDYTDHHPIVTQSKLRLRPKYRHYSSVIVDVFYDHLLAHHWSNYHTQSLAAFASSSYSLIQSFDPVLPEGIKRMLPYMIKQNWLLSYAKVEGIQQALSGMARRTSYVSKMEEASLDLVAEYAAYENEFKLFFDEARQWAAGWLKENYNE